MLNNQRFLRCFSVLIARSVSSFKMPHVVVRAVNEEKHMTLSFDYGGKQRSMKRDKLELLQKTLQRISLTLVNKKKSKRAKVNASEEVLDNPEVKVELFESGKLVNEQISNVEAWKDGCILKIGDVDYNVELNWPIVTVLSIPDSFMAGFPVFPVVEVEFAEKQLCHFRWFKSNIPMPDAAGKSENSSHVDEDWLQWQNICSEFIYTPAVEDIGCYLRLECVPVSKHREGHSRKVTSNATVSAGPGSCPFDERHLYTNFIPEGEEFRVLSYNILADIYATGEFAETYLYPYCPKYALGIQYRRQLLLKEIMGYNADIICLQECGRTIYKQMLLPALEMTGYFGMLQCKAGEIPEGEAMFFRSSKFQFVEEHNIVYKDALVKDVLHEKIFKTVSDVKPLFDSLQRRGQIGQVAVIKCVEKPGYYLCIANTHLYFKPYSPNIRLIQSIILLKHVEDVVKRYVCHDEKAAARAHSCKDEEDNTGSFEPTAGFSHVDARSDCKVATETSTKHNTCEHMAVLFCGDFNSNPLSAMKQLFTEGKVSAYHPDWTVCEEKDQHITTLELGHNFNLHSVCDNLPFTNYTTGYKGTLDYVFSDTDYLEVNSVVPVPEASILDVHVALPSVVMPSDHLALVCDLKWKQTSS